MENKLLESGLTLADADKLGLVELAYQDMPAGFKPLHSIKIPYYDINGADTGFYRIRYLADAGMLKVNNVGKYSQEKGSPVMAYFPRNQDWSSIVQDVSRRIVITEGEFKAAKACKEGFATIGLGGVWSWKSKKLKIDFLPELEAVKWLGRETYICFDSDYATNPDICYAAQELALTLQKRGASTFLVRLPGAKDVKVGLDDYLCFEHADFEQLLDKAEQLGVIPQLLEMNQRYTFILSPPHIYDKNKGISYKMLDFKTVAAPLKTDSKHLKPDGSIGKKPVKLAAEWLEWGARSEADRLTYLPGKPLFVDGLINTWQGYAVEPVDGSASLFFELIDHLFTPAEGYGPPDDGAKKWFIQWLAYPLQNPGAKLYSAAVLHGQHTGTGKTLIGMSMGAIYGRNFSKISGDELTSTFNGWADKKQFILGEEITGNDNRAHVNKLKKIITQDTAQINNKYGLAYEVPDFANYLFTSNDTVPFFIEGKDRRFFVHTITQGRMPREFYKRYDKWLKKDNGAAQLFHALLNVDCSDFDAFGEAYKTESRSELVRLGKSELECWVAELMDNPDYVLAGHDKDLYSAKQLVALYNIDDNRPVSINTMSRRMSEAGAHKAYNGWPLITKDFNKDRYFIVRNADKWLKAEHKALVDHLNVGITLLKGKY